MISILGGIGLIFFGVRFLRKGLDRLFGGKLMGLLSRVTNQPLKAFLTGTAIGTVAPSSTGASLMTVQMLNSRQMEPTSMLAVLLGTNVGITVAVQFLAFRIQDYAGILIFGGMVAFLLLRRELLRGIGQCVLALGFVFLAINIIGDGARELSADPNVREVLHVFSSLPGLALIATAVLSIVLQSSTASIGLGIAMASGGLLDEKLLSWWVIGTNLGIGFTTLATAWATLEGRRMGMANLLLKATVAAALLTIPHGLDTLWQIVPGSIERKAAMLHTNFNLLVAILALPFLHLIWKGARALFPDQPLDAFAPGESYLDDRALNMSSVALARASRECMRMAEHVRFMLDQFWTVYLSRDCVMAQRVQQEDDKIDTMNLALKGYLIRIDDDLVPEEVQWQFALHGISSELEAIGDVIDKHLCDLLIKQVQDGVDLSGWDREMLEEAFRRISVRLETGISLLTTRDVATAAEFLREKEKFNQWLRSVQSGHYMQLNSGNRVDMASSASFLDFLNGIHRINSHLSTLGYAVATEPPFRLPI